MPDFKLITDSGPSHHKSFMFNVVVNGGEYKPEQPSPNKKNAKAQAASAALRKLGLTSWGDLKYVRYLWDQILSLDLFATFPAAQNFLQFIAAKN